MFAQTISFDMHSMPILSHLAMSQKKWIVIFFFFFSFHSSTIDITPPTKDGSAKPHDCTIDITPPSKDVSPVAPHPRTITFLPARSPVSPGAVCKKEYPSPVSPPMENQSSSRSSSFVRQSSGSGSRGPSPDRDSVVGASVFNPMVAGSGPPAGIARRLARSDRLDTKRYYTAGVIEDIKVHKSAINILLIIADTLEIY